MLFAYRPWLLTTVVLAGFSAALCPGGRPRPASEFLDLSREFTETELVTRALASDPILLAQRQQIAMAKGDVDAASPALRTHRLLLVDSRK